ncbi:MAG: hypothetical protein HYT67_02235 [Candidatus Yanofskybacteria bacterium]|nr:hypothetical protein [Candidatus Yanofskybacteria bacterium]
MYTLSWIIWFVLTMGIYFGSVRHGAVDSMDRFFSGIVMAVSVWFMVAIIDRRIRYHYKTKEVRQKSGKIQEIPVSEEILKETAVHVLTNPPKFPDLK